MKKNNLMIGMSLVFLIAIVSLGLLIFSEKGNIFALNNINKKLDTYIEENFNNIEKEAMIEETNFNIEDKSYSRTITNNINENLTFIITYNEDGTISENYEEEYYKGLSLIESIEKDINKYNKEEYITINLELDQMSDNTKEDLINDKEINLLPIYTLNKEIVHQTFEAEIIAKDLLELLNHNNLYNITEYSLKITTVEETYKLSNITKEFITREDLITILPIIISDHKIALNDYNIIVEKGV